MYYSSCILRHVTHTLLYEVAKSALLEWLLNDFTGQKMLHFVFVVFPQQFRKLALSFKELFP